MSEMRRGRRERFFLQKPPSHSVPFSRSVLDVGSERVNSATAAHTLPLGFGKPECRDLPKGSQGHYLPICLLAVPRIKLPR